MLKRIILPILLSLTSNLTFAEPLQVWGNGSLPPMGYKEDGKPRGFGVEITTAVLNEAGIEYELNIGPWKRAYLEAERGQGIVFGLFWTEERAKIFDYSKPLWEEKVVIVTQRGKEFPFQKIEDLKGKTISMQRGARPGTEFEEGLKDGLFKAMPNNDPTSRLRKLNLGRVEAAIFNPGIASVVWTAKLAKLPISEFTVLKTPLSIQAKHIGIAKFLKQGDLIVRINGAIDRLKENGTIDKILLSYQNGG